MTESENFNLARAREMAIRGKNYTEDIEVLYYGEETTLTLRPLVDIEFLPVAAFLQDKLGLDTDEAQEMVEEEREENGSVNPANFDEEFVEIMQAAAVTGLTRHPKADCDDEDLSEEEWDAEKAELTEVVGALQGGKSLEIAERVLDVSSDAEKAESFRRDGGSK